MDALLGIIGRDRELRFAFWLTPHPVLDGSRSESDEIIDGPSRTVSKLSRVIDMPRSSGGRSLSAVDGELR